MSSSPHHAGVHFPPLCFTYSLWINSSLSIWQKHRHVPFSYLKLLSSLPSCTDVLFPLRTCATSCFLRKAPQISLRGTFSNHTFVLPLCPTLERPPCPISQQVETVVHITCCLVIRDEWDSFTILFDIVSKCVLWLYMISPGENIIIITCYWAKKVTSTREIRA